MNTQNIYVRIAQKCNWVKLTIVQVGEVTAKLNEILLDPAIRLKRKKWSKENSQVKVL